jgi:dihydroxyacetone kinase-like protein
MKKIINKPEDYTIDMLRGIYAAHKNSIGCINNDLHCYYSLKKKKGKVGIITGGGTGHLPLFLGYVGEGMLDGCAVGNVFQSPSAEQIFGISKEIESGNGLLYLYGNYTGDIMNFDMAVELCNAENIKTMSLTGADDVCSAPKENRGARRGVSGIFYQYKCVGAAADQMISLEEVYAVAKETGSRVRTAGFALTPCILPEIGKPNFVLSENEMAIGMGIHGEPGIWNGPLKTSKEIINEMIGYIIKDMPISAGDEVSVLINGLGSTPLDELYILYNDVNIYLNDRGITIDSAYVGEFATSMEMAGASISLFLLNERLKRLLHYPVNTPFFKQI